MAASALIVKVPEAEAVVSPLRARFDATSQLGVPAHITILFPFMDPGRVSPVVLKCQQRALACMRPASSMANEPEPTMTLYQWIQR
jgi:hypothetical protein